MDLIDTHAHLGDAQFSGDREDVISRAADAGVPRLVEIADSPAEWNDAVTLSRAYPGSVLCSLGLHPYYADQFTPDFLKNLEAELARPQVAAIGEIGLDYVKAEVARERQISTFEAILTACRDWEKPAVIHCRGAYEDLRAILKKIYPNPPQKRRYWGVVHCFSGDGDDALDCARRGFALGVDGPVTYPKNGILREAFREVGIAALVLETDSPYLPPQSSRGKRNEPAALVEIARKLSETLGMSLDEVARGTTRNAEGLFGFKSR